MNKIVYQILGVVLLFFIVFAIGTSVGVKSQKDKTAKQEIKVIFKENEQTALKIDSLAGLIAELSKKEITLKIQEKEVRKQAESIKIEIPENEECMDLYGKCTDKISKLDQVITIKDSVEVNLREQIVKKDGIIDLKDYIISNKDKEINLIKEMEKPRDKKFQIGLQLGTGFQYDSNKFQQVPIYVGIGISRKIVSF